MYTGTPEMAKSDMKLFLWSQVEKKPKLPDKRTTGDTEIITLKL